MDSILLKFKAKFVEEAHSLLDKLEHDLLELEKEPQSASLIESAFRAMHTIKGVSGMYGFGHISDYTHHMESIYQNVRDNTMAFNQAIFDVSFLSIDHIRKLLSDENLDNKETAKIHEELLEKIQLILCNNTLEKAINTNTTPEEESREMVPKSTYNIILKANEKLYFRGVSITDIFRDLASIGEFTIEKVPQFSNKDTEAWSIFLKSTASLSDVEEILMFIEDDCVIKRVGSTEAIEKAGEAINSDIVPKVETISLAISNTQNEQKKQNSSVEQSSEETTIDQTIKGETEENQTLKTSILLQNEKQAITRISVDAVKLDQLMFLVSELITVNSTLLRETTNSTYEPLWGAFEKIDQLSKLFRNNAIEIRLVPLGDTILRFQRLIRDLSRHLNKKVELQTQGIEVELDKNTVDQLAEPLMHMIRNCIDHGIETPKQRVAKGKPETGAIKITANQSGSFIFIVIEDDGNGIDSEIIRKKAIEKGFIRESRTLSRNELFELIFLPGFSTAQSLTDVSGRGVGMDVVRKKIIDLRGEVSVDSEPGVGTKFTLKIQQSVSILDTLLFQVENSYFTIPISDIELCDDVDMDELDRNRHTSTLAYNNELISFVDLRKAMGISGQYGFKTKEIVIKSNNKTFAVLADNIIGEHQAVLKPLGRAFSDQPLISSASQLGDGNMAFMLDINILSKTIAELI